MLRLPGTIKKNIPQEYDRIFQERAEKGPNWQDMRRWRELLRYYEELDRVVDLGCLDSRVAEIIDDGLYLGVDYSETAIKEMSKIFPKDRFEVGDICNLIGVKNDYADYVILGEVLEHLEEPEKAIKEAHRILKPGGCLALSVPLEEAREPGAVDGERHLWSFSKADVINLLKDFKKVKTKVLRSQYFPKYRYAWPTLIIYAWK